MNVTLEAMARAIFKSWFVDFDPVHAKARGEKPFGMSPQTAALFPAIFQPSPLGPIPEGCDVVAFADVASHKTGAVSPAKFGDELVAHFSIPGYDNGHSVIEHGRAIKSNKTPVPDNAVLLSKLNPETPRVWLPDVDTSRPNLCSTEFLVLVPKTPIGRSWLYCLCLENGFRARLEGLVTGTSKSHQRIQPPSLMALPVIRPRSALAGAFEQLVGSMTDLISANVREARLLANARDALLPKLLEGGRCPE